MSAQFETDHPVIRRLGLSDVDRLYAIDQEAYPFPWTRGIFVDCLRAGYACFGLQLARNLVGYTIFTWAAGEAHLLNLCVHPDQQRQGLGGLLLDYTINYLARLETTAIFLEVRVSNQHAATLYKNMGFSVVGRRPAYYQAGDKREDAIVMRLEL